MFVLGRQAKTDLAPLRRHIHLAGMRRAFSAYDRFPKFSVMEAIAINGGTQLPIILIAAIAVGPQAGYLMLATRIMSMPMSLIGAAVAQVYLSRAPEELRNGSLDRFTVRILDKLIVTGVGPLIGIGVLAPLVTPFIFGPGWERTGELISWMIPWVVLQFLSSPISMAMHVLGRQREMLVVVLLGLAIRVGAILIAARLGMDIIKAYICGASIFYLMLNAVVWHYAGCGRSRSSFSFMSFCVPVAWLLAAVCLRFLIESH
jgi:O-antigen/teichoic acid export membrane protein